MKAKTRKPGHARLADQFNQMQAVLDAMPANIAILDKTGTLVAVNAAWRRFAVENGWTQAGAGLGMNYFDACKNAVGAEAADARDVADGFRRVMAGELAEFRRVYCCSGAQGERWFQLRAAPLGGNLRAGLLVEHTDLSHSAVAEESVRKTLTALEARVVERTAALAAANRALTSSNEYLDAVISASPAAIAGLDLNGKVMFWSPAAERIFGFPEQEVLGRALPLRPAVEGGVAGSAIGAAGPVETQWLRQDGEVVDVLVSSTPLRDSQGGLVGWVQVLLDDSGRKHAERALQEERRLLQHIVEASPDLILIYDLAENRAVHLTGRVAGLFGYTPEELLRMGTRLLKHVVHPDDLSMFPQWKARVEAAADGEILEHEYRVRDVAGRWRTLSSRDIVFLRAAGGQARQVLCSARDVTTQKETELALRASEQRFSLFMGHQPNVAFIKDPQGRYVYVNEATSKTWPHVTWIGRTDAEIFPPDVAARLRGADLVVLEKGEAIHLLEEVPRKDEQVYCQTTKFRIPPDGLGAPAMIGGTAVDITQLKRTEEALQRSQEELRALAARLLKAEEEESRRLARELHDDLNQRLAVLAVELGMQSLEIPESAELVREKLRAAQSKVSGLSDDLRRLAYRLHPAMLDDLGLDVALRALCEEFSRLEAVRVQFLTRSLPASIPRDIALCFYRIAQECLRNVAKHAGTKTAKVTLTGSGRGLRMRVIDYGTGFHPEAVRGKGGLGLISMEERARLVGGSLSIHSRPGDGTKVTVFAELPGGTR